MKTKLGLLAIISLMLGLTSCLKEGLSDQTLVLFGEESNIKSFKELFGVGANDTLTQDNNSVLVSSLNIVPVDIDSINDLVEPPDIRGTFRFDTLNMTYPHSNVQILDEVSFVFTDQHHMTAHCKCRLPGLPESTSNNVVVKGKDNRFYAYFELVQTAPPTQASYMAEIKLTRGVLLAGSLTDGTMSDVKLTLFNKEVRVLNPEDVDAEVVEGVEQQTHNLTIYALTRN